MAYTLSDDEENQRQAQGYGAAPVRPAPPAPAPAPSQPAQPAPQAQAPAQPAQSPSSFVSFDRYLGSNYGKAHAAAQGIAGRVGTQAQNAQNAVNAASTDFTNQVQAGGRGAAYKGPTDFDQAEGSRDLDSQLGKATDDLSSTSSNGGLQNFFDPNHQTNASYTGGMSRFDAALTGGAGRRDFEALRQKYAGLDNALSDARSRAAAQVADAQAVQAPGVQKHDRPQRQPEGETKEQARRETQHGGSSNQHVHHDQHNPTSGGVDEYGDTGSGNWSPTPVGATDWSGPTDTTEDADDLRRRDN